MSNNQKIEPPRFNGTDAQRDSLINELTTRAVAQIYPSTDALNKELKSGRRLTIYFGVDPTGEDLHVGHESQILKLSILHRLGHRVILMVGDFTAMIGDPTDKSAQRVILTREQVLKNAEGYKQQAGKILDFEDSENPVEFRYNSEWLSKMDFGDVLELASEFTVQQMLERDMFDKRIKAGKPVSMVEFLYPLMQGYDSVALDVDVEVGGSDQIFNMLAGTTLIKRHKGKQKFVIAGQLLVDPSGKKIGKTEGNMITLNDTPLDMFHKIMMWGDAITPHALELCSKLSMDEVQDVASKIESGELSGLDGKMFLARTIVTDLHGEEAAKKAEAEYGSLTGADQEIDVNSLQVANVTPDDSLIEILVSSELAPSNSQARRLIEGNAVRINGQTVGEDWHFADAAEPVVLQVGKKKIENHRLLKLKG